VYVCGWHDFLVTRQHRHRCKNVGEKNSNVKNVKNVKNKKKLLKIVIKAVIICQR